MLIGLAGKARSGKDSVAAYLHQHHNFHWIAFADALKRIVGEILELSEEQLYGDLKETEDSRFGKTPRWLLQYIGTDVFREIHPNCWANKAIRDYKLYVKRKTEQAKKYRETITTHVVISDVRFYNELDAIKTEGGYIWKIVRFDNSGASGGINNHASECELDNAPDSKFQSILSASTGQLDSLYKQVDVALEQLSQGDSNA